ncbi:hypothetical protein GCM10017786_50170 [Amycolatopsis deserti]|uniref:HTH gntR-type domain-containing protein n=1 Tax=Amycolatopsis deserti TaxID=185696 RepID=A0ABQ3J8J6_9PSEU|nr:hypothetical protein GCM10017786_50170 [Amycolatopsis deserti]
MVVTREDIAGQLRERILAGDLKPGERLPSTRELVAQHGGSRTTANQALRLLAAEGLVALREKSAAVVLAPEDAGKTPESRLADARTELLELRDEVRTIRHQFEDLELRLSAALGRLGS